jgi:hypothetical protein
MKDGHVNTKPIKKYENGLTHRKSVVDEAFKALTSGSNLMCDYWR